MTAKRTLETEYTAGCDVVGAILRGDLGDSTFRVETQDSRGWVVGVRIVAAGDRPSATAHAGRHHYASADAGVPVTPPVLLHADAATATAASASATAGGESPRQPEPLWRTLLRELTQTQVESAKLEARYEIQLCELRSEIQSLRLALAICGVRL